MKLLCITDPSTHPQFDTTVELYNRLAEHPEVNLFHTSPECAIADGLLNFAEVQSTLEYQNFLTLNERIEFQGSYPDFDLVYSRADKPFLKDYYRKLATHESEVRFVNSASGSEEVSQRIFLSRYSDFMPADLFTRDVDEAEHFAREHGVIVGKLNVSYGGKGVFRIMSENSSVIVDNIVAGSVTYTDFRAAFEHLLTLDNANIQLVRYLPRIGEGDKRVLVVDGEIYGAFLRRSTSDHWVHNITSGGGFSAASVTSGEKETIESTCRDYHARGVYTLGYDFLMDDDGSWTLSEINAGNIGGYGRVESLTGERIYDRLIQWMIEFSRR